MARLKLYAANMLLRLNRLFPAIIRIWYSTTSSDGLNRQEREIFNRFFLKYYANPLIEREISRIASYNAEKKSAEERAKKMKKPIDSTVGSLTLTTTKSSTSILIRAIYKMEESSMGINLTIPPAYPLEPLMIEALSGQKAVGISESKQRSWLLASQTLFNSQTSSYSILDGLLLWKSNVDRGFQGFEPCSICYCIVSPGDRTLPGPTCKTCKNKFHATCLYKWFKSSTQATCPMCRSLF